jgi:hypothetical protein
VLNKPVLFVALNIVPPTVGINYSLILIRVGMGTAQGSRSGHAGPTPPSFDAFRSGRGGAGMGSNNYPLKVTVTQNIEDDAEMDVLSTVDKEQTKRRPGDSFA